MLEQLYPRYHARFSSLPLLGPHVERFVVWLDARGYPRLPIRHRVRELPRVDGLLRRRGARQIQDITAGELLHLAPKDSQTDMYLSAVVRSLARYFVAQGLLARPIATARAELVSAYRSYLVRVRGFAESTQIQHGATALEFLEFVGFDGDLDCLHAIGAQEIDAFVRRVSTHLSRSSLHHSVSYLRSFLRFLASQDLVAPGLDVSIDTPRLYRGERLPRALAWETVCAFLATIDRSTLMGKRDYAMFLLICTYGLRASEVSALRLDDIEWRAAQLRIPRPKAKTPLVLPLTEVAGAALIDYLRCARPDLAHREVFLRVRAPAGPIRPTVVSNSFRSWAHRSGLPIPHQGPHCLRHSVAVHLLRQGASLKAIGDLLGHRSAESTCIYLQLHVEDLREVALDLPQEVRS